MAQLWDEAGGGRAWLRDQLLLHSDDIDGGTASDLAGYVFAMSPADAEEYLTELLPHVPGARVAKICAELGRRSVNPAAAAAAAATPTRAPAKAASLNAAAPSWGGPRTEKTKKTARGARSKRGTLILSNTATRQAPKAAMINKAKNVKTASADTQKIVAQLNPFLAGAPPAQFVANCLCCGAIVWYNEREEKVCNSGKSRYCHDLLLDACDPETGAPDPDYALTKKARKKKRRAREERESMAAATSGPANGMHGKDEEGEDVQSRPTAASASLTAARARAERLVGFDKNRSARSEVYDDQSDYFQDASSSWLSPEEREAAQAMGEAKRKEAEDEKRNVRVTFDFAGRRVVEIVEEAGASEGGQAGGGDHNNNAWRKPGDQGAEVLGRVAGAGKSVPAAAAAGAVPDMESSDDFPVGAMPKSNALFGRAATIYAGLVERMRERAEDAAAAENKGGDGGES